MFKRANKITALLVAAASVMSLVPAMAADSAKRLGTKDGTITNAVAFKDGKYLFEGYKSDDNDTGLYYNDGSKDKLLDDATEFVTTSSAVLESSSFSETTIKYDDKDAMAADGSDRYVVDLSTGKVTDEDAQADLMDNVKTKLNSKLDKTDRYTGLSNLEIMKVDNGNFGDTWYQYTATTAGSAAYAYGFTTDGAKYIDASNLANISVYVNDTGNGKVQSKVVKVEEFDKAKDGVTVSLNSAQYLAQDKDNIYVLVNVTVTGTAFANEPASRNFVQKLSKTQGDKKDDAYLPKTVTSYELDNKAIFDNDDSKNAYLALTGADGTVEHVSVIDGSLYVTVLNGTRDNVKVEKLDLKKDKIDLVAAYDADKTKDVDVYIVKKDDDSDQDIATGATGWSVDTNGYTWVIDEGKIYKFNKLDKQTVYTCDRAIDTLDVYDDSNLIAWDASGDAYTTVGEGTAETATEATPVATTPATVGWKQEGTTWTFYDATGAKVANKWVNAGGVWYFLKADGVMATGWYNDNGTWYFLKSSGAMATGWVQDGSAWYYLNASGAMLANTTTPDGYVVGANGAWIG